jgi:ferredoxin
MNATEKRKRSVNIFWPFLRRSKRVGWQGFLYRLLERIAPTTRSSPARRAVQIICLVLFVYAFFYVCWPYSKQFSETTFSSKEYLPVELFLLIDPLVGLSTAVAGRIVNLATLSWTVAILLLCVLVPRAFCGYLCPLGTFIDGFDWLIGRHFKRFHRSAVGPTAGWVHIKYYILGGVLVSSLFGVLTSGFVSAIPVLTRGLLFTGARLQLLVTKGPSHLSVADWTFYLSVILFSGSFLVSLLGRRFWCRYVCPTGALLSVFGLFRVGERKVASTCTGCGKCREICPFDAVKEDFTTRTSDCTYCQTCGGVCPADAISFVSRWQGENLKAEGDPSVAPRPVSRRAFVAASLAGGGYAAMCQFEASRGSRLAPPLRPPGSVPEREFLDLCIRCGECIKVCPGPVLHAAGMEYGLEALWTPVVRPEYAGCHQDCNFCTQVCPTGAIQPLEIAVKRKVHMGVAKINTETCLPLRAQGRRDCDLCYRECSQAGYNAIELRWVPIELDPPPPEGMFSELELEEMSRIKVPVVDADKCVGCGICQYRCHKKHVSQESKLPQSAIVVLVENEHRLRSYPKAPEYLPKPNTSLA